MNERTRYLLIALVLLAAGAGCYWIWVHEPAYEGRSLSEWVEEAGELQGEYAASRANAAAQQAWEVRHQAATSAIRAIGSRALPHLLRWMRNAPRPSLTRDKIQAWLDQQSWVKLQLPERRDRSDLAYFGIQVLGSNAIPAIPELSRMLVQRINPPAAAACLQVIGPSAYPALARGLTNSSAEVQHVALFNLLEVARQLGPTVSLAMVDAITNGAVPLNELEVRYLGDSGPVLRGLTPWLESLMHNPTNPLAGTAMRLVTVSGENPAGYVPFFSERLTNATSAPDAAFALARVGPNGIPTLLQALTNPNPRISGAVLAALHPELKTALPGASLQSLSMSFDSRFGMWTGRVGSSLWPKLEALATSLELAGLLDHPGVPVRLQIVQLLERCGVYGAPGLSRAAEDGDETVRSCGAGGAQEIGCGGQGRGNRSRASRPTPDRASLHRP